MNLNLNDLNDLGDKKDLMKKGGSLLLLRGYSNIADSRNNPINFLYCGAMG
jgi:hypothetical protein